MHIGNRYSVNICNDLENNVVELIVRWFCRLFWRKFSQRSETQSESSIISKKSFIAKIVKNFESLTICTKRFIENVWLNAPLGILSKSPSEEVTSCLLFRDGGPDHIDTSPLICSAGQWTGFCILFYFCILLYLSLVSPLWKS